MMSNGLISGTRVAFGSKSMRLQTHVGPGLHHWNHEGQIPHAHQVVSGAGEGEKPVHLAHSAMPQLAHEGNRLQPAEAFFNPFPLSLADDIAEMPRGATINRAPPRRPRFCATCVVTRRFRHSCTKSRVSNPLSPPTVTGRMPGSFSNITSAASRSAVPLAWNTSASTIRPWRFSTNRFPV